MDRLCVRHSLRNGGGLAGVPCRSDCLALPGSTGGSLSESQFETDAVLEKWALSRRRWLVNDPPTLANRWRLAVCNKHQLYYTTGRSGRGNPVPALPGGPCACHPMCT